MTENNDATPENPEEIVDDIVEILDRYHQKLSVTLTQVGYTLNALKARRPTWAGLSTTLITDPEKRGIYESGVRVLSVYRDELKEKEQNIQSDLGYISGVVISGSPVYASDTTTAVVTAFEVTPPHPIQQ